MKGALKGKALKHHNQWHSDIDNAIAEFKGATQKLKRIKQEALSMGVDSWTVVEALNDFNFYELKDTVKSLDPVYENLGTMLDRELLEAEEAA
tara:strand:+ start:52 stop:330 length:279 start_codon:yes stop_codon:yes gene_type:complete